MVSCSCGVRFFLYTPCNLFVLLLLAEGVSKIWCSCVSVVIFSKMATTTYAASPAVTYAARAPVTCAAPAVTYAAAAPAVTYAAPAPVTYAAPAVSYAAPAVSYTEPAPAVTYAAPAVSYTAPSTSGDVRCAAPSHVRGCCSRGDVRRGSGQLRGSITDHRDLLSYVTFLLPQRQLTSLRGPTAFSHAHVRLETIHRFGCTSFRAPESRIASEFQRATSRPSWLFTLLRFRFDVSWQSRHKVRVYDSCSGIFLERR